MFKIYNGNDLRSGLVVYLTADTKWSEDFADALLVAADDETLIEKCEQAGKKAEDDNLIVAPYWVDSEDGTPAQMHMRERMRVTGPTMRTDNAPAA